MQAPTRTVRNDVCPTCGHPRRPLTGVLWLLSGAASALLFLFLLGQ